MLDIFNSILLGAVEGITEFLPISSTGHLILVTELLGIEHTEFVKSFEIAIQLGAILAVVALYWKKLFLEWEVLKRVITAFIPTGVLGFILYPFVKTYLLGNVAVVLWTMLLGGVFLIGFEKWYGKRRMKENTTTPAFGHPSSTEEGNSLVTMSVKQALIIGLAQSVSMVPGVSRAAATIVGGLFLGLSRKQIVEFSFLLAIPTMAAATGLDLMQSSMAFSGSEWAYLSVGFASAFVCALFAVRFLLRFIMRHTFVPFGVYRILAALLFFLILF